MRYPVLFLAALSALLAVVMGAFGAHALKTVLTVEMLTVYKTAVNYHMWHALGLGLIAVFQQLSGESCYLLWAGRLMFSGIVLFSGSLYLLAILNIPALGMITPLGGLAFIAAWGLVLVFAAKESPV